MTIATIITVTVSLALIGAGLLLNLQVNVARDLFFAQVEVSIFLDDSLSGGQVQSLEQDLRENPEVSAVEFESKEEAFESFEQIYAGEENLLAGLTPDDLPSSFRVSLVDPERFDYLASQYLDYPGVEEVTDQRDILERFFSIMNTVRVFAFAIAIIQGVAAVALIYNTIRVTAFARRTQSGIMKLVGASNWYIRAPFMLEGIISGVVGAILAGGLLWIGVRYGVGALRESIAFFPFITTASVWTFTPLLILIGAGLAAISSFLALRRFIR
jgi:cell division transport system permease protein